MIYFLFFFVFLILAYSFDFRKSSKNRDLYYKLECFALILLWGLRYRVGGDSLTYEEEFMDYPTLFEIIRGGIHDLPFQPLWYFFNGIIKSIIPSFVFFQVVHAIIVNVVVFSSIKQYSKAPFTAALFYFVFISYNMNTEILREALSVCLFLIAFKSLNDNKLVKYYFLATIAFLFHQSAVFLFVLPLFKPFLRQSWTLKHYVILGGVVVLVGSLAANALEYVIGMNMLSNDFSNDKAMRYYANAVASQGSDTGLGGSQFGIRYLLRVFLALYVIYVAKKTKLNTPENNLVTHAYLFLTIMGFLVGLIAGRWNNYFLVLYYCIIADLLYDCFTHSDKVIVKIRPVLILSLYMVLHVFALTSDSSNGNMKHHNEVYRRYYPYHSILNPQKEQDRENLRYYELYQ